MVITRLEKTTKGRIKIYLNDEFAFMLYRGEINSLPISVGADMTDELYDYICDTVLTRRAKLRAMNILQKQDKTEKELRDKLREGLYPERVIDAAIAYVKSYSYIDDERFARNYVSYRLQSKSKRLLERELRQKGVPADIIENVLEELTNTKGFDEDVLIVRMAEKKCGSPLEEKLPAADDRKSWEKLYRYLIGKGFEYEKVKRVLSQYR